MPVNQTGLARVYHALVSSLIGLSATWKNEAAFRLEALVCLVLVPAAFYLGGSVAEQVLLLMSLFIVVIVELLNSAVEAVVDRVGLEYHKLSGQAKDMGSAAVFVSMIQVGVVWGLVGAHRLLN